MICPICDRAVKQDECLMLTHNNTVIHCFWDEWDEVWVARHESKPDEYTVSIDFSNKYRKEET